MSIVIITTKENVKRDFANQLYLATDKGVKLVIITKNKKQNFFKRLKSLYNNVGFSGFIKEMWYALALRLDRKTKNKLSYFKNYTPKVTSYRWLPEIVEVDDVNTTEVHDLLAKISSSLLVIWDTTIIKENILKTSDIVINLHMGVCPHYRGAVANQFAMYKDDFANIGSTIHYVDSTVDGGNIIKIIKGNLKKPPLEMFRELNDKSQENFLAIAIDIFSGKKVHSVPQDMTVGENFKLKHWIPSVRYKTARKIAQWEKHLPDVS